MKKARILVLVVALAAGGLAALLAGASGQKPAPAPVPVAQVPTVEVLVVRQDIGMGHVIAASDLQWQTWPATAATSFIRRGEQPNAIEQISGAIVRHSFVAGEPIREMKIVKANGSGFMSALLPAGKRAVATEISAETGVGGFILPRDHVDVILTRRDKNSDKATDNESHVSEIVLANVRVMAIDQAIEEKNGLKVVIGKTATLELTPRQTEILASSKQQGKLSLALRSIADSQSETDGSEFADHAASRSVNMVRFGVTTTLTPK